MMMDAIPCRLVFLALIFGARIQHTEGKGNTLSSACCMSDYFCVFVQRMLVVWGRSEGRSLFASNCSPKECLSFCKDGAGQSETERERKNKRKGKNDDMMSSEMFFV